MHLTLLEKYFLAAARGTGHNVARPPGTRRDFLEAFRHAFQRPFAGPGVSVQLCVAAGDDRRPADQAQPSAARPEVHVGTSWHFRSPFQAWGAIDHAVFMLSEEQNGLTSPPVGGCCSVLFTLRLAPRHPGSING